MTDDTPAEAQVRELGERILAQYLDEPGWLILGAHVACLVVVAGQLRAGRPTFARALRNLATVIEAMGDTEGEAAAAIVREHGPLFDPEGLH